MGEPLQRFHVDTFTHCSAGTVNQDDFKVDFGKFTKTALRHLVEYEGCDTDEPDIDWSDDIREIGANEPLVKALAQRGEYYDVVRLRHSAAQKALLFKDTATAAEILKTTSPRKQKGLGRQIEGYDEAKWVEARITIVQRGNLLKFSQCTNVASMKMDDVDEPVPLKSLLLATGVHDLVEASPFDDVWGIGFQAEVALSVSRAQWGQNLLGKALMHVREELRETG
ncbi:hypothetical protein B0A54_12622 [Friedmanniomyces endolithicus]|uniref:NADAR domain-containing protein n=1 Tax=Friedmanniomyces endolithicus TaxID=329885 RepID=A0A4U0UJ89_9PEZI|nr:hypothetical protein B0A54_12622 [Friedmanniomyces endolithicus]